MALAISKYSSTFWLHQKNPSEWLRLGGVLMRSYHYYGQADHEFYKANNLGVTPRGTGGRCSFNGYTVTVFGNTGFFGRTLVSRLGKIGTQLILPYRDGADVWLQNQRTAGDLGQILFHQFDVRDADSVERAMTHSNVVINLIGTECPFKAFSLHDVNVTWARNVARMAKRCGVERFIHMSALNATPSPQPYVLRKGSEFYRTKWLGEQAVFEEFPEATVIRPADIYGDEDRFMIYYAQLWRRSFRNSIALYKRGNATIKQPIYKGDVAAGIINIMKDPTTCGQIYQAVGPHRYKLGELVTYFFRLMKRKEYHRRHDLMRHPLFLFRIWITNIMYLCNVEAGMSWERIERECQTDIVHPELKTLEDVGVVPDPIENHAMYVLYPEIFGLYMGFEHTQLFDPERPPDIVG